MKLKKKVLIVSAKWPSITKSTDGGDSTLKEIILSLKNHYCVDILSFRDDIEDEGYLDGVNKVYFHREDYAVFMNYSLHNEEKFLIRLKQSLVARTKIRSISDNYDFIIVQHVMFLLSMENDIDLLEKVVLYPMFTGSSYLKSGEVVPKEYFESERKILKLVKLILTPSIVEKDMLVDIYGVNPCRVFVVPRPVDIKHSIRNINNKKIRLIYIASIRIQKNHLAAMKLIQCILKKGIVVELHCVGAIQDNAIYHTCLNFIKTCNIERNVIFHGNKSSDQVECIMSKCDFNISVSNWETFGRGIYEGMIFGLPTIVLNKLESVVQKNDFGVYPYVANTIEDMAEYIITLSQNNFLYREESKKGLHLSEVLNSTRIYTIIREKYVEVFG